MRAVAMRARALGIALLALSAVVIAALTGEVWLRFERRSGAREAESYRSANVFALPEATHAAEETLWKKPWRKYRPGADLVLVLGGERYRVRINSLGFRTPEFSPQKPAGAFRVACVGGSTTVAGRTNEETYPALLGRKLQVRHPGIRLEVLNLGISGTTSDYWVERPEKLLSFEPDVVVEYRAINDIFWRHLKRYAVLHPWRGISHRSLLLARMFPLPPESFDLLFAETLQNFGRMEQECRRVGAQYVVGSFASPDPASAERAQLLYLDASLDFWNRELPLRSYAEYRALLQRHNLLLARFAHERHLDLVPVAREITDPGLFVDICHLTPEGIERLADAFLPAVSRVIESGRWRRASRSTSPGRPGASKPS